MKKIILFLLITPFIFISINIFSYRNLEWINIEEIDQRKLKTGDIIILNIRPNIYSIFGHSAIYIREYKKMAEYPKPGKGCVFINFDSWIKDEKDRKAIVLRGYKHTIKNQNRLLAEVLKSKDKKYKIVLNKKNESGFYCSQWIWNVYHKALNIDIDNNKGILALPYDFILSKKLKQVNFH